MSLKQKIKCFFGDHKWTVWMGEANNLIEAVGLEEGLRLGRGIKMGLILHHCYGCDRYELFAPAKAPHGGI